MTFSSKYNYYNSPEIKEKIAEKLTYLFTPSSRLDKLIHSIIQEFMQAYIVPYFLDVITRHSEDEFHQKIANGFDIIDDMRINHPHLYYGFIRVTRKFKKRLAFNEAVLLDMIVTIVEGYPFFWHIGIDERSKLYDMIMKMKMEIYE